MRRMTWLTTIVLVIAVVLVGCGKKDAGGVVKDLGKVVSSMESYQGAGRMILQSGQQPQEYAVEVWYQSPHFYRIMLKNEEKDITQIVLRNEDGVFVLTPHLNKSFRFQSDWPENQQQVYLYQSLVKSITEDAQRNFTTDKESYVFEVAANYSTGTLTRQKIWLDQKSLKPQKVEVSDASNHVVVKVDFTTFEFGKKFEKDSFDMQRNMTSFNLQSMQTMTPPQEDQDHQSDQVDLVDLYIPNGVSQQDISTVKYGENDALLIRYTGKYNYSVLEAKPREQAVSSMIAGDIVDLGFTMAVMTGDEKRTLSWISDGVEYRLTTSDLPKEEMIQVAQSSNNPTMMK
ncbi:outer membrane lipoprotein carrier protein LolA [Paenibacillus albiflavus]|uniref:Outer membrane lipoprotein carrier protein LolA n=1 Tax=Paenibacillus albiflavus TaxID=2545760 RepID=A0A4R4E9M8_9BACL|nr:outer membrane lipoprotein carrier protein LolA [Paenibacillus albiflavus]TCZ76554.1 outer membrane lipoprotein carrier protein LolA [Paenibacillus albiflavus]